MNAPTVNVQIDDRRPVYYPGDTLSGWYRLDADQPPAIQEIEVAVMWHTEGPGDEDIGVFHFEKLTPTDGQEIGTQRRFSTRLPHGPFSYDGLLVKIVWCVRVRMRLRKGHDIVGEAPFRLGEVSQPCDPSPKPAARRAATDPGST